MCRTLSDLMTFSSMEISKFVGLHQSSNLDRSMHCSWDLAKAMSSGRMLFSEQQLRESRLYSY